MNELLNQPARWKHLKTLRSKLSGRVLAQAPATDEFAEMLEGLFCSCPGELPAPTCMTEALFNPDELDKAIAKLKPNKSSDECGLAAELLKHTPQEFRDALLTLFNEVLVSGSPCSVLPTTLGDRKQPRKIEQHGLPWQTIS